MKFDSKNNAYLFLKSKKENNETLTEKELEAVKEFFTAEELVDLSFVKINMTDCYKH
jgi:hypothetical protein